MEMQDTDQVEILGICDKKGVLYEIAFGSPDIVQRWHCRGGQPMAVQLAYFPSLNPHVVYGPPPSSSDARPICRCGVQDILVSPMNERSLPRALESYEAPEARRCLHTTFLVPRDGVCEYVLIHDAP